MKRVTIILCALALVACGGSGSSPGAAAPDLTETHHCGYGFYLGDGDQTWALKVTYRDFQAARAGEVPRESALPGDSWYAELEAGQDLFANWCDDVLEPDEPTPEIRAVWNVSGDVEMTGLPDPGECGPATANLTGLEARNDTGDVISLGDLDVENALWGCLAG